MPEKEFCKVEKDLIDLIGDDGMFAGDVSEQRNLSMTMLKSLVKRSVKLEYRGHRVEISKPEQNH
jgi:predicted DNA-binding ArsR family transcriptional regulator